MCSYCHDVHIGIAGHRKSLDSKTALLMHGMMCASMLLDSGTSVSIYLRRSKSSTSHVTIVGSERSMTEPSRIQRRVTWYKKKDDFPYVEKWRSVRYRSLLVVAWTLSYGFAMILFLIVRTFVLRSQILRQVWFLPVYLAYLNVRHDLRPLVVHHL